MVIGVLAEQQGDRRVPLTPKNVAALLKLNVAKVVVESGAGDHAYITDAAFQEKGAAIGSREDVLKESDILLKVSGPSKADLGAMAKGKVLLSIFNPLIDHELVGALAEGGISSFSLDLLPRTTRAQAMDVLSSMSNITGYKSVILAASKLPSFFPMFMTAAGTVIPAKVLILGAGVAGLQAIATARRLGAVVHAFDVRAAAKEEVLSLGAKFVDVEGATDDTSAGGYAVEQTEEYKKRQAAAIAKQAADSDVVICTALIQGRKAPILITKETVEGMRSGSVIVDLAAVRGGNCALTQNDKTIEHQGVTIIGDSQLASTMPADASMMLGNNFLNFLKLLIKEGELDLNMEDDLVAGSLITHENAVTHERVKNAMSVTA